jgi:cell wall assembly regulator SMI1
MDTIEELWQRIEAWMHQQAPQRWHQLAPGASEEAIKNLESILSITLPRDVRPPICGTMGATNSRRLCLCGRCRWQKSLIPGRC